MQGRPFCWSDYGGNMIYVALTPDQTYPVEFDSVVAPADITGSTTDPIIVNYQSPIKYYAAALAQFYNQQDSSTYFSVSGLVAIAIGVVLVLLSRWVLKMMGGVR
jgi:hypothetical protein